MSHLQALDHMSKVQQGLVWACAGFAVRNLTVPVPTNARFHQCIFGVLAAALYVGSV